MFLYFSKNCFQIWCTFDHVFFLSLQNMGNWSVIDRGSTRLSSILIFNPDSHRVLNLLRTRKSRMVRIFWMKMELFFNFDRNFWICYKIFNFLQHFQFFTKFSTFYNIFNFLQNFQFLTKFATFHNIFNFLPNFQFLTKISIFDQIFNFFDEIFNFIPNI